MRQRHTLWWTRGTGGVHNAAEILGRRGNWVDRVLLSQLAQVLNAHDVQVVEIGLELVQILLLKLLVGVVDDMLDRLNIAENIGKRTDKTRVKEDSKTRRLDQRMLQSLLPKRVVCSNDGQ